MRKSPRLFRALRRLIAGEKAFLPEEDIAPLEKLDSLADLGNFSGDSDALRKTAVLKLNGGIGTTMGLRGPKSLLEKRMMARRFLISPLPKSEETAREVRRRTSLSFC